MKHVPNNLIKEQSKYLLQHAYNPVKWHAWNTDTLQKAIDQNKIILLSIGYSSCHWCHVMEKESFEDESVAAVMNSNFICIKVDREERPDLDHIYMEALQILTGSGGWPLNIFLTPQLKPFYGGTYFPPVPKFNKPSWLQVLNAIADAAKNNVQTIVQQSEKLTEVIQQSTQKFIGSSETKANQQSIKQAYAELKKSFDIHNGGFGSAPKFPMISALQFLLRYYFYFKDEEALEHVVFTVKQMIYGGIYDQLKGGFARYSTDNEWLVPHFEKMLYDNAGMIQLMADLYKITHDSEIKNYLFQTIRFVQSDLTDSDGGFFSSIDADSEAEEGKYYLWTWDEIHSLNLKNFEKLVNHFQITEDGNWDGKNILTRNQHSEADEIIKEDATTLLNYREQRIKPETDKKKIASWNGMMNEALVQAYVATGENFILELVEQNTTFLKSKLIHQSGAISHSLTNSSLQSQGMLEDYAFIISALIHNYYLDFNPEFIRNAKTILNYTLNEFYLTDGFYSFNSSNQKDLIVSKPELFDNTYPSSNSILCRNLIQLGFMFNNQIWKEAAVNMLNKISQSCLKFPTTFSYWFALITEMEFEKFEVAVLGTGSKSSSHKILRQYVPNLVLMSSDYPSNDFQLLNRKVVHNELQIFLCKNDQCNLPVTSIDDFFKSLTN